MYTTKGNLQKYLNVDIDDSFNTQVTSWITAVQAWIDRYCGKTFEGADETRYYDGDGSRDLSIDDITASPTTVKILNIDGTDAFTLTEGASDDYLLYPLNTSPKNVLKLVTGSSAGSFPSRKRSVEVVANFGFSTTVPADVEQVATILVSEIIKEGLKGGKLAGVQIGDYEASFQKIDEKSDAFRVFQTLDLYRDLTL